jgi:hypothetical protein
MAGLPAGCLRTRAIRGREADASPESSSRPGFRAGVRTPVNVAVEPAGAVPAARCVRTLPAVTLSDT